MVVITIISVVAVLAIPSLSQGGYDRRVFTDAATIGEIVREARTRSVGRGAAELLAMTATPGSNSANFALYESVTSNPGTGGGANVPVSTCNAPTVWPGAGGTSTANFVDGYQFAGGSTLEGEGNIVAQILDPNGAVVPPGATLYLCFTPNGRVQYQLNGPYTSLFLPITNSSNSSAATAGAVTVQVSRGNFSASTDLVRTVWIPPSGATRITSQ
jgi:type II secretory pathway pseudopilin PulG